MNDLSDLDSQLSFEFEGVRAKLRQTKFLRLQIRHDLLDMFACDLGIGMRLSILRRCVLFFALPACAFSATNVVNLSHYDMMRPDFATMKRQGIVGVIHEATYPPFVRDAKYLDRQMGALQAGLLWGAYHYG